MTMTLDELQTAHDLLRAEADRLKPEFARLQAAFAQMTARSRENEEIVHKAMVDTEAKLHRNRELLVGILRDLADKMTAVATAEGSVEELRATIRALAVFATHEAASVESRFRDN